MYPKTSTYNVNKKKNIFFLVFIFVLFVSNSHAQDELSKEENQFVDNLMDALASGDNSKILELRINEVDSIVQYEQTKELFASYEKYQSYYSSDLSKTKQYIAQYFTSFSRIKLISTSKKMYEQSNMPHISLKIDVITDNTYFELNFDFFLFKNEETQRLKYCGQFGNFESLDLFDGRVTASDIDKLLRNSMLGKKTQIVETVEFDDITNITKSILAATKNGEFEYYPLSDPSNRLTFKGSVCKKYYPRQETLVYCKVKNHMMPFDNLFSYEISENSDAHFFGYKRGDKIQITLDNGRRSKYTFDLVNNSVLNYSQYSQGTLTKYTFNYTSEPVMDIDDNFNILPHTKIVELINEDEEPCLDCALRPTFFNSDVKVIKEPFQTDYSYRNGIFESKNGCGWVRIEITHKTIYYEIIKDCENSDSSVGPISLKSGFRANMDELFCHRNDKETSWFLGKTPAGDQYPNEKFAHFSYGISCKVWHYFYNIGWYEMIEKDKNTFILGDLIFKRVN